MGRDTRSRVTQTHIQSKDGKHLRWRHHGTADHAGTRGADVCVCVCVCEMHAIWHMRSDQLE